MIRDHGLMLLLTAAAAMWAQAPPPQPPAEARQLPLSGREQQVGTVTASQTLDPAGNNVQLRGSVQVHGSYAGSVPTGDNTGTVLPLRLDYALTLALRNNLGTVAESHALQQAQGQLQSARSTLLPQVNSLVTETLEQLNLRTLGVAGSYLNIIATNARIEAAAAQVRSSEAIHK